MRPGLGSGLLLAALVTFSANAATVSSISLSGTELDTSAFTANFTVTIDSSTLPGGFIYTFMDNNATVNGSKDPVTINVSENLGGNTLEFTDTTMGLDKFFDIASNPDLFFDPSVPAFNEGTYPAFDFGCLLTASVPVHGMPGTLAMFQAATTCLTNVAFTVSTVTPEPSSIALFGTGFLGVAGIVRRRFYA